MKTKIFAAFFGLFVFIFPFNAYALPLTDGSGLKNSAFSDVTLDIDIDDFGKMFCYEGPSRTIWFISAKNCTMNMTSSAGEIRSF